MKKIIYLILLALPFTANAEALFEGGIQPGYRAGTFTQITALNKSAVALAGFEGAFVANSAWYFGFTGGVALTEPKVLTGLTPPPTEYERDSTGTILDSTVFYADSLKHLKAIMYGVKIGYISNPSWLIHWTTGLAIGSGNITLYTRDEYKKPDTDHPTIKEPFFYLEPEFGAEVNVTNHIRVSGSLSYRLVSWFNQTYDLNAGELSGLGVRFALQYGSSAPEPVKKKSEWK